MNFKKLISFATLALAAMACDVAQEKPTEYSSPMEMPTYNGKDLGVHYTPKATTFKVWSPVAEAARVIFYDKDLKSTAVSESKMKHGENGVWVLVEEGDLEGKYYTFQLKVNGEWLKETPGIYAKAVGCNGMRGQVIDFEKTNPEGWETDKKPELKSSQDIVIYELHVRDMTIHPSSGSSYPGKFLGLAETGTRSPEGEKTGIDHLKELGVTHVHLLPSFDYRSVDESRLDEPQFNWGYDPQNYNVPEGSYSTNPHDGTTRVKEFKQMVKALHDNGIRVIMDVVYNHTFDTENSNFNNEVPKYYYRLREDGSYSDASACGNETASELPMMRKYMIESVLHWVNEYHVDGFRFDLMGIHDVETMNQIAAAVKKVDPTIFVYGEGWTASDSPLPIDQRGVKANVPKLVGVAAFSDEIRDGIKGSWSGHKEKGFASGKEGLAESIKFGVVAATKHDQIDYQKVNYTDVPWANEPSQTINYVSCHDNHTLLDKLKEANEEASMEELIAMHKLSNAIVLTTQGVSFLHAGVDMLRTKSGVENSYNSPDSINQILWNWKAENREVFDYYQGLIAVRKAHPAFRMPTTEMIQQHLRFIETGDELLVNYAIEGNANGDSAAKIVVFYNGSAEDKQIEIPEGKWKVLINGQSASSEGVGELNGGKNRMKKRSVLVLARD
ncbi:type I pullulanase [Flammeovirgaceae bacterium SG7u.111]|nr:type I pullulanase [Flammeovirgaceae bacterium SG7u.132]WPO33183.1 type I pullulanase [Flammeovirgaceae bacterium SG7u.111]